MRFPLLTKLAAMGLVMLLLGAVLLRIDSLVAERRVRQAQAAAGVEDALAGPQTLLGPLLHRTCTEEWDGTVGEGKEQRRITERREFMFTAAPQALQVAGDMRAEPRYRGLFKVNSYAGSVLLKAHWDDMGALQPVAQHTGGRLRCGPLHLMLSVQDVRGIRSAQVQLGGAPLPVLPGTGHGAYPRGLHAVLPPATGGGPLDAVVQLQLAGTASLALVPAAGHTRFSLQSDWPHPSFNGRFLPTQRTVAAAGFDASWDISSLASAAANEVGRNGEVCRSTPPVASQAYGETWVPAPSQKDRVCMDTLGVAFIDPVNPYVLTDRATKYALLFIVLTFGCVALTELMSGRRVHPVQYTLVGLALALFYLLLLSLSEHIAFDLAYAAASAACVLLLGYYASHMLGRWRAGAGFGAGVALLYGALWTLLQMEQAALLIGAVLLFGALVTVMVLTRRVNWYTAFAAAKTPPADADAPVPQPASTGR
jgi:inner membrane protein